MLRPLMKTGSKQKANGRRPTGKNGRLQTQKEKSFAFNVHSKWGRGRDIQDVPAAAASAALRLSSFVNSRSCHRSSLEQEQDPIQIPTSDHSSPAQAKTRKAVIKLNISKSLKMYFYHLLEYGKHINLIRKASGTPSYRVPTERDFS